MNSANSKTFEPSLSISYAVASTALGEVIIGATDRGICFLQFGESAETMREALEREFPLAVLSPMPENSVSEFGQWMQALESFLDAKGGAPELPLDIHGTVFQVKVWRFLQSIPPGRTASYAEVAAGIGHPGAHRAVATACARNRVAILIPCHRVIRGSGALAGYRWGLARKQRLLEIEKVCPDG